MAPTGPAHGVCCFARTIDAPLETDPVPVEEDMRLSIFVATLLIVGAAGAQAQTQTSSGSTYLGNLSTNTFDPNSISNPFGQFGSSFSSQSIANPYSTYGSPYSSQSVTNPYATDTPKIYGQDGTYLGKLSSNRFDPESVSNPNGQYGSPYSSTSINNPYSTWGSPFSAQSATNPFATQPPIIVDDED